MSATIHTSLYSAYFKAIFPLTLNLNLTPASALTLALIVAFVPVKEFDPGEALFVGARRFPVRINFLSVLQNIPRVPNKV